ncbi:MAG: hypothetical protein ACLQVA_15630 [Candidatus Brocadiia bacterium]
MRGRIRCGSPVVVFGIFLLVRPAYGYIDPGTGSYVLQILLGVLLTAAYTLKIYWRHVVGFFRYAFTRKRRDEKPVK